MMFVASGIRSSFVVLFAVVATAAGCGDVAVDNCGPGGGGSGGSGGNGGCLSDADCDDGDPCTLSRCEPSGACVHFTVGGCGTGGQGGAMPSGGEGGACVPTVNCNYDVNCGMMDDGCGNQLDCDHTVTGQPATCAANGSPLVETGPMTCSPGHVCQCPAEGNTKEALSFCEGAAADPTVNDFCALGGGCDTALCGIFPVPKAPKSCMYSGRTLKPVPLDESTWIPIWCCVDSQ